MSSTLAPVDEKTKIRSLTSPVRVAVHATDRLVRSGLIGELSAKPGIELRNELAEAEVVVAVAEPSLQDLIPSGCRLVLIADRPKMDDLWTAIERGLTVLVPRQEVTSTRLLRAVSDAYHNRGDLPADQLGRLLRELTYLQEKTLAPLDLTLSGLSSRETEILRLLADGLDTVEIAAHLNYSERTVKNILHRMHTRLGLRNRAHAVAHALRRGLI
ncbi:response regulator transcription factor [Amycolatopsis sp. NPDC049868]|uniref:response regulator transcription factor n=1 Tax=Amycolatopsis sp. NPDC049868 TaxID=3363934 RepID=UPI00378FB11A